MNMEMKNDTEGTKMLEEDLDVGVVLGGRYELLTPVAKGGMGRVWVARVKGDRGFKRFVAVKTMLAVDYEESRLEDMLFQEARFASMIDHPNVVAVEDFGVHQGVCYLAMELVRGETLLGLLKMVRASGGLPLKIAVNLIGQVCRGLQAAHDLVDEDGNVLGLIHRDVTPGNVIVTYGGVAKLLDFGIAKASTSAALTQVGEIKGKMAYMAPEMLMQETVDHRIDIFAVGVMLYLVTTGLHPFRCGDGGSNDVLARIVSDKPPMSPTDLADSYPEALERVVMKALAKNRDKRYSSAEELLEDLMKAVPEAFGPGIENEIQAYLEPLLSERISESSAHIKAAEEMAEKSSPDLSKVQVVRPEAEKPLDPMREVGKVMFWVLGILLVPMIIIVGLMYAGGYTGKGETVYLPGETKTITVQAPAPSASSAPKPAATATLSAVPSASVAPKPAPRPPSVKRHQTEYDLWVPAPTKLKPAPAMSTMPASGLPPLDPWTAAPSTPGHATKRRMESGSDYIRRDL
jgi:serine/threonine protein kinase